ncbi:hypothetical protein FG379_000160 [Cryptosporidium bovis]|uniref:uncharacterized protein n=1 Tax=Cryptosporidium bovis TaxID=310047 RepID=UPI00351A926D|nr:hypothetical protein FG379_000160 [Cryptosporidium bovis]
MFWNYHLLILIIINSVNKSQSENIELVQEYVEKTVGGFDNYSNIVDELEENLPFGISPSNDYNSDMHVNFMNTGVYEDSDKNDQQIVNNDDNTNNANSENYYYYSEEYDVEYTSENNFNNNISKGSDEGRELDEKLDNESQVEIESEYFVMSEENESYLNNKTNSLGTMEMLNEDSINISEIHEYANETNTDNVEAFNDLKIEKFSNNDIYTSGSAKTKERNVTDETETIHEEATKNDFRNIKAGSNYTEGEDKKVNNIVRTRDKSLKKSKKDGKSSSSKYKDHAFKKKNISNKEAIERMNINNAINDEKKGSHNDEIGLSEFDMCLNYELIDKLRQEFLLRNIINTNKNKENRVIFNYLKKEQRERVSDINNCGRNEDLSNTFAQSNNSTNNSLSSIWECNIYDKEADIDVNYALNSTSEDSITSNIDIQHHLSSIEGGNESNTLTNNDIKLKTEERLLLSENISTEREYNHVKINESNDENRQNNTNEDNSYGTEQVSLLLNLNKIAKRFDYFINIVDKILIMGLEKLIVFHEVIDNYYADKYKAILLISVDGALRRINVPIDIVKNRNFVGMCITIGVFVLFFIVLILVELLSLGGQLFFSKKNKKCFNEDKLSIQKRINSIGTKIKVLNNNTSQNNSSKYDIESCVFSEDPSLICQNIAMRNRIEDNSPSEETDYKLSLKELRSRIEENNEMLVYLSNGLSKCTESLYA